MSREEVSTVAIGDKCTCGMVKNALGCPSCDYQTQEEGAERDRANREAEARSAKNAQSTT